MKPVAINGEVWNVLRVKPDNPLLVDRTGYLRIATTDATTRSIYIADNITPPLLDMVLLHEVAHAITISHGLLLPLRNRIPLNLWVLVEEWSAELVEKYGVEAVVITSESLGRPLCVNGYCIMAPS